MTTEPRDQQEPSMEEILSSIRRIIADEDSRDDGPEDDELGAAEARSQASDDAEAIAAAADDGDEAEEDVLELTRVVRESGEIVDLQSERSALEQPIEEPEPGEPAFARGGREQEIARVDHKSAGAKEEPPFIEAPHIEDKPVPSQQARNTELVSGSAASVASGAFAKLSQALQRTPEEVSVADNSGRTVEQFIEDIARPMLKEWLDEYLPAIVERLVQKEIQKIARRAELN